MSRVRPLRLLAAALAGAVLLGLAGCGALPAGVPAAASSPSSVGTRSAPAAPTSLPAAPSIAASSSAPVSPSSTAPSTPAAVQASTPAAPRAPSIAPSAAPTTAPTVPFDRAARSLSDPRSIWVVVDKRRPLRPKSWVPTDLVSPAVPHTNVPRLRRQAAAALVRMFAGADRDGIRLVSLSAYRSYATQQTIFERNLATLGRAKTLRLTAKPGYSEHQTGLADDLGDGTACDLAVCFESHPAARWLRTNAWRYGWIQRYPPGLTAVTGIQVEPWHFRFVGTALARDLHRTGVKTLEQYFGLPAAPSY